VGLGGVVQPVVASDDASLAWLPPGLHWLEASDALVKVGWEAII
jgi:hypothetical protein